MGDWYPIRLAQRDGTPVILWVEDEEVPPIYPVTVGVWETDDMTARSHWHDFGGRFGTHTYLGHIVGWRPLPDESPRTRHSAKPGRMRVRQARF
jgi:hypothetical protein